MPRRPRARALSPVGVPLLAAALIAWAATGGCSASSRLVGEGGCDAFCAKVVGSRCRNGPSREDCLEACLDQQARCRPEANAFLRCATIEANIACETGSGVPRVLGCAPREQALERCLGCDRFCEDYETLDCGTPPVREACVATCVDRRCWEEHAALVRCAPTPASMRGSDGTISPATGCFVEWGDARSCVVRNGGLEPFRGMPAPPPSSDAGSEGFAGE